MPQILRMISRSFKRGQCLFKRLTALGDGTLVAILRVVDISPTKLSRQRKEFRGRAPLPAPK